MCGALATSAGHSLYRRARLFVLSPQEGPLLHFVCSMVAGLACATTTAPVDIVKTR